MISPRIVIEPHFSIERYGLDRRAIEATSQTDYLIVHLLSSRIEELAAGASWRKHLSRSPRLGRASDTRIKAISRKSFTRRRGLLRAPFARRCARSAIETTPSQGLPQIFASGDGSD
jgi:hypothetical protein